MVTLTVLIPDELKAEMEKFPDVNWSELTRKSIQVYLQNRQNRYPPLEFELKELHTGYLAEIMEPAMPILLRVTNNLDSELIVDRILLTVKVLAEHVAPLRTEDFLNAKNPEALQKEQEAKEKSALLGAFKQNWLKYQSLIPGDSNIRLILSPPVDLLRNLNERMQNTFWIDISLEVYVLGFVCPVYKNLSIRVPIDEWKSEVATTLNKHDFDWKRVHST